MKKPKIRFKGFTETWEQRKLETYLQEYNEVTSTNNQYPALTSSRKGLFLQTDYFSGNQVASENNIGYNVVPYGYFTYRHMSDDEVFHFNLNDIVDKGIVSTLYPVFTTSKELDSKYLQYQLNYGEEFSRFARLQKQGGSRTYMYLNKLRKLSLTMPNTLDEQKEISAILSTLDHFITLHQRKCENLKKLKKFMLQKMFPQNGENVPKVRFLNYTDTWEQRKLGEVFNERTERAKGNEELLSVTINNGVIRQIDSDKRNIASEDKSNYKIVQIGDVPYNSMRMWQGAVGNSEYNGIVSPAYTVLVPSTNADSKFFVELFKKNSTLNIFQRWSQGLTSDTWNLKYPILSKIEFYMPMIDEQKKIGSLFSKLDNLITLHQSKCDKLKEVKKYMLQNMFI